MTQNNASAPHQDTIGECMCGHHQSDHDSTGRCHRCPTCHGFVDTDDWSPEATAEARRLGWDA